MEQSTYEIVLRQHIDHCVFCSLRPELVVHENEFFGVCLDPAPIVPGHLIVYSKMHVGCAAEVEAEYIPDLAAAKMWAHQTVTSHAGPATFYEHGRAGHCLAGNPEERLCHHFHLHCLPGDYDLRNALGERFLGLELPEYEKIGDLYDLYGDYLYIHSPNAPATYFVVADKKVEAHLFRTLISEAIRRPERADWSTYQTPDLLLESIKLLETRPFAVNS